MAVTNPLWSTKCVLTAISGLGWGAALHAQAAPTVEDAGSNVAFTTATDVITMFVPVDGRPYNTSDLSYSYAGGPWLNAGCGTLSITQVSVTQPIFCLFEGVNGFVMSSTGTNNTDPTEPVTPRQVIMQVACSMA